MCIDDSDNSPYWDLAVDEGSWKKPSLDVWQYSRCERLVNLVPVPIAIEHTGTPADYDIDAFSVPIVSRRLADLLIEIAPHEIQLIPALIENPGEWFVLNVLSEVDAIDYKRSVMTFYEPEHPRLPGKPRGVVQLILDPAKVGDHRIFRLHDWMVAVVVSEAVKRRCELAGMTNMKFVPVSR